MNRHDESTSTLFLPSSHHHLCPVPSTGGQTGTAYTQRYTKGTSVRSSSARRPLTRTCSETQPCTVNAPETGHRQRQASELTHDGTLVALSQRRGQICNHVCRAKSRASSTTIQRRTVWISAPVARVADAIRRRSSAFAHRESQCPSTSISVAMHWLPDCDRVEDGACRAASARNALENQKKKTPRASTPTCCCGATTWGGLAREK